MNASNKKMHRPLLGMALLGVAAQAWAEPGDVEVQSALKAGTYLSPSAEFALNAGKSRIKDPLGGVFAVGYRDSFYAVEAGFEYSFSDPKQGTGGGGTVKQIGGVLNGLIFPTHRLPGLYGLIGAGELAVKNYPGNAGSSFSVTNFQGGLGYLQKLRLGSYQFALRAEAAYRYGFRENGQATNASRQDDPEAPRQFHDVVFRIGLVLPIDISHWLSPAPEEPVKVVPVVAPAPEPAEPAPAPAPSPAPEAS